MYNDIDIDSGLDYLPLRDPKNKPFRLALSCGLPTIYDSTLTTAFARCLSCYTFDDIDAQPNMFGLLRQKLAISELIEGEKPNCIPPFSQINSNLIEWWDSYLWRAILTAYNQGGICFNLAKFSKARIELALHRYKYLRATKNKQKVLFLEFSQRPWSLEECDLVWPSYEKTRWPTYTEWEIAYILGTVDCNNIEFFEVYSEADLDNLKALSNDILLIKYGIGK
ncbi:MAG: hypothetical protein Q8L64_02805 [bacterium]|nr:hypothetical protein [bacterium]